MEQAKTDTPLHDVEVMDLPAFKAAYGPWLEQARHLLEAANWKDSFATYPFPMPQAAPWTPFTKDLSECRLALISTAGVYLKGEQEPFDAENIEGDWTFRELPATLRVDQVDIAHTHYDHTVADQDLNSVLPLERLRELEAEGVIGELLAPVFSISGYCTTADKITEISAPAIVARLK